MSGWDQARSVEAEARVRLRPFLEDHAESGLVFTDKGPLAPFLQDVIGDVLLNKGGFVYSIELKAERRHTGNLFLETFSNRNLDSRASNAMRGINPGWMLKTRADFLFYYFMDDDKLYVIRTFALQQWAFGHHDSPGRIYAFPERRQAKYVQANDTHGRCVSIDVLNREMKPAPKLLSVSQLSLALEAAAE